MKKILLGIILITGVAALTACTDGFPDEQMHLGIEDKVRPFAVIIEPPDAAPGDTVQVSFWAQTSDPDELDITWRVALDYSVGLYDADEIERNYRDIEVPLPVTDEDGFLNQTFQWVIPDSTILWASDIPEVLDDPVMVLLAEELIGPEAGSPPTKSAVDAWLKELNFNDMNDMGTLEREATWALADRFAVQVRFRAALRTDAMVEVTRNLTIRYTKGLWGPNTNENEEIRHYFVVAVEKENAPVEDIFDESIPQTGYFFISNSIEINDLVQVPYHAGWTYYMVNLFSVQSYSVPFDPGVWVSESTLHQWYYYRQDQPLSDHQFFVDEDGDGVEMFELDSTVRIMPAGIDSRFRVVSSMRDHRYEWVSYNAVPGQVAVEGIVKFVAP